MLFLDTSAFVKLYFKETGSEAMLSRVKASRQLFTASVLSFAEVHSAIARKYREKQISVKELSRLRSSFERDWETLINAIELNRQTLAAVPKLVEQFPLRAADAIHLSTALWLKDNMDAEKYSGEGSVLEFAAADQILGEIARRYGLQVFNPEDEN